MATAEVVVKIGDLPEVLALVKRLSDELATALAERDRARDLAAHLEEQP